MIYKLYKSIQNEYAAYAKSEDEITISFIFDPANTDYANFKAEILADQAQLQNADGNVMSADEAKEFVKGLP